MMVVRPKIFVALLEETVLVTTSTLHRAWAISQIIKCLNSSQPHSEAQADKRTTPTTMNKLVGTWELIEWDLWLRNGDTCDHLRPFGGKDKAVGRLMYSPDGTMSAVLQRNGRPDFAMPGLTLGTPQEKSDAIDGYVSYSGSYRIDGSSIVHGVEFSLLPNWIGTELIRDVDWSKGGDEMIMSTRPVMVQGKTKVERLRWRRKV